MVMGLVSEMEELWKGRSSTPFVAWGEHMYVQDPRKKGSQGRF